jgi:hypothetical protein
MDVPSDLARLLEPTAFVALPHEKRAEVLEAVTQAWNGPPIKAEWGVVFERLYALHAEMESTP